MGAITILRFAQGTMMQRFLRFRKHCGCLLSSFLLLASLNAWAEEGAEPQLPEPLYRKFAEVYATLKHEYVDAVDDDKLFRDAVNGVMAGLDPYSTYLDYEGMKDSGVPNKGPFGGLGIEVAMEDGSVKVVSPIEDTPACQAGIQSGDLITMIDDTPVKGLTLAEAIQRMRGAPQSSVRLSVSRKQVAKPLELTLVRAVINNPSVKFKLTERDYPYLRITQFREHTGEDMARALIEMREQNRAPLKGLVLDLRNNPGGSVVSAVAVASAFLRKDALVVSSEGRGQGTRMRLFANPENYIEGGEANDYLKALPPEFKTVPLVVLVNGGSASAAEIVAGALQDHHRGTVMGTRTFGKGTIQTLYPLSTGSALKLTVARYFTPSGRSIQKTGITPDIAADEQVATEVGQPPYSPGAGRDAQFMRAIAELKSRAPR